MRKILRYTLIYTFALITIDNLAQSFSFASNQTILTVALTLSLFDILIKPILKFLLFPINLITLGSVRIIINLIGLLLAQRLNPGFSLQATLLPFGLPPISGLLSHLVTSLYLSLCFHLYQFFLKKK